MDYLDQYITNAEQSTNQSIQGSKPTNYKAPIVKDVVQGAWYGTKVGTFSLINAGHRLWVGDEEADQVMQFIDDENRPETLGTAGEILSGLGKVVVPAVIGGALTGGAGAMPAIAGGGVATFGATRSQEHAKLTQKDGVSQKDAEFPSNLYAATNALMVTVPASNVAKGFMKDIAITVGGTTAVAQGSLYAEGAYLESKGYEKVGQQYKEQATDPTAIATNLILGGFVWKGSRYLNARNDPNLNQAEVDQAGEVFDQAVVDSQHQAHLENIPVTPKDDGEVIQHQINTDESLDQILEGSPVKITNEVEGTLKPINFSEKTLQELEAEINQVMTGKVASISEATGGQFKTLSEVKTHIQNKNKSNNTVINTPIKLDIKAPIAVKKDQRVKDAYQLAQQAGFSQAQARALIGEVGRENSFNPNTMFGFHTDEANHKKNGGIFSWQEDRAVALEAHMKAKGLVNADGTFKRTNESLHAQFEFLRKEIEANPKWKASFLDKKNLSNEEARQALGGKGSIIGWARGQSILKSGKSFDWQAHEARANNYSNMVDGQPTSHIIESVTDSNLETALPPLKDTEVPVYESVIQARQADEDLFIQATSQRINTIDEFDFQTLKNVPTYHVDNLTDNIDLKTLYNYEPNPLGKEPIDLEALLKHLPESEIAVRVPYTAKGVSMKDGVLTNNEIIAPDLTVEVEWNKTKRYQEGKYRAELSRSYKNKEGKTIQELQYRNSFVRRTLNDKGITESIHVGQFSKSDYVNHKGNKELETALNRVFDTNNYGYLSQVPKGKETIAKLDANPSMLITSKRTGDDLTAEQWKKQLQREQDNILTIKKAMQTLATCALSKTA